MVERSLRMREARGSIPRVSTFSYRIYMIIVFFLFFSFFFFIDQDMKLTKTG
jgi:hypothetical protein